MRERLVVLGCGFVGREVARRASASSVIGTVRGGERADSWASAWPARLDRRVVPTLTHDIVRSLVTPDSCVLVAFPPDGRTDRDIAPALAGGRIVYISTTGVYGSARGRVDETTEVDPTEPRASLRLDAERSYRDQGATVLRVAGIYGPWRGLHRRLLTGDFRIPGKGTNVVSRIHVADLAKVVLAVFEASDVLRGGTFVLADDSPVPQIEAIVWLCRRLAIPVPAEAPIDEVAPTLRHDRAVDNTRVKQALSLSLDFPSYREGFEACLSAEGINRRD